MAPQEDQTFGELRPLDGQVLHVIVGHGLPQLFLNTVASFRALVPDAPLLVVDNASPQAELRKRLRAMASGPANTEVVLRAGNERANKKTGGLYAAYRLAFARAARAGARLVHLMQADMQLLWWDQDTLSRAEEVFARHPNCVNVVTMALSRDRWLAGDVARDPASGDDVLVRYGITDTGLFHLGRWATSGASFGPSEAEHGRRALELGLRAVLFTWPTDVQVPWPAVVRDGRQKGREVGNHKPLLCKPLDGAGLARLKDARATLTLEEVCTPWGWACLSPMWNTDLDNVYYWALRRKDIAVNGWRAGRPRWVTSGLSHPARALMAPHRPSVVALFGRPLLARAKEIARQRKTGHREGHPLSVVVAPRADNPYQDLLYSKVEAQGVTVRYADGPTRSQTLNIALAPAMLAFYRLAGARVLHLHWVYHFSLPWAAGRRWGRRLMQAWFGCYVRAAGALGYKVVWTAHNILPHEPVFADDAKALADLLGRCDLVIALSGPSADELRRRGARNVVRSPVGPYLVPARPGPERAEARAHFGLSEGDVAFVHVGKVFAYKGLDVLLEVVADLPADTPVRLLLAGSCPDGAYADRLRSLAAPLGKKVVLELQRVDDKELERYLSAADAAVFAFRAVTNSSSVLTAQCYGLPVVVPDLPMLAEIPAGSAVRYDGTREGLRHALEAFSALGASDRQKMGAEGRAFATTWDWATVAGITVAAYRSLS